jgi:hypothetical protein
VHRKKWERDHLRSISLNKVNYKKVVNEVGKYLDFFASEEPKMQTFFDPYGNCIKLDWNPEKEKIKYSSGIIMNHLEYSNLFKCSMWRPDIHPSRIFMSKITSYT